MLYKIIDRNKQQDGEYIDFDIDFPACSIVGSAHIGTLEPTGGMRWQIILAKTILGDGKFEQRHFSTVGWAKTKRAANKDIGNYIKSIVEL